MKTKTQTKQIVVETKQILQIVGYSLSLGFILSVFGTWLNRSRSLSNFTAEMTRFYLVVTAVLMLFIAIHLIMNQRYLHHPVH
ncbi:hypothetical protein [Lentilactobacillus diolivorans]|uniref:Uncharacterized protein n=1 Tax=Lentilactobacillus diolivorans DSM 14421 TaxID=1423739 RepID=A0A0R1SI04_9LACO|nr:hypothetical protein [Lentilactobacillus diolivorans]KRL66082.1 hypothetical protein FC85_GL002928 [Lentilactobacillus diolivorans DSM 14421]